MKQILMAATVLILLGGFLIPAIGLEFGNPAYADMDEYMIENGQELAGINNIVTAVLFDFRGFDTLGEATVLFTAVLGIGLVFRKLRAGDEYEYE
ncbi:MAG: hypothetical protein KO206_02745 [Methanomicrobiaceae archaeon]|uniref:Membrane bound hydrogenase, mbhe subunit n=1 Tax=hydrocarbon metagenome TaxID=938273 RepID=A0A0W8FHM1_9ZZZZ|nr:hypothetical protein [Methanomicrobiaceae archaeon]MDD5419857.1 hypothetical protein [Methanomicrobiaceae archaeon]